MQATCLRLSALSDPPPHPLLESFIIVIYLQLKMPNIYLILSILQFICLPNRSSNKSAPSPIRLPSAPAPALLCWVTFGWAYRLRLVGKIFNFLPELSEGEKKSKSEPKNKLAGGDQSQQSAPLCCRRQCWHPLAAEAGAGAAAEASDSSQIWAEIWLSIIDGGNNGNVTTKRRGTCSSFLLPANGHDLLPAPLPPPPCLCSPTPAAATTRFLFENHFVCFMDLRSLKWLRRFVCLVLLLLKIFRREWKAAFPLPLTLSLSTPTPPFLPACQPAWADRVKCLVWALFLFYFAVLTIGLELWPMAMGEGATGSGNWLWATVYRRPRRGFCFGAS